MPVAYPTAVTRREQRIPFGGVLVLAAVASLLAAAPVRAASGSWNDSARDEVKAARAVPDPKRKVGEVRLVARGGAVVVQTLLATRLLDRVTSEIRKKEEASWPAGDPSREAYLAALERTRDAVAKRDVGADWKDRRRRLLIEFAADDSSAAVFLGTFAYVNGESGPIEREVLETLELPRSYVLRNMRLILADSFEVTEGEVDSIGPLGPASSKAAPSGKPPPGPPGAPN